MAEPTTLAVGLKASELDKQIRERLFYLSSNYETHHVTLYDFCRGKYRWQRTNEKITGDYMKKINANDEYYGFAVAQTWNGVINFDDPIIQDRIKKAKEWFRKLTGKEGKVLLIGEQT